MTAGKGWLESAEQDANAGDNLGAIASALTGILAAIVDHDEQQKYIDTLQRDNEEMDRKLGAVRDLLDWPVGRDTGGVDRLVPASEIAGVLDGGERRP